MYLSGKNRISVKQLPYSQYDLPQVFVSEISDNDTKYDQGIKFCLTVNAEPEIKLSRYNYTSEDIMQDDEDFYVLGKEYEFRCEVTGNPQPKNVTWVICDGLRNFCINYTKYDNTVSYKTLEKGRYQGK